MRWGSDVSSLLALFEYVNRDSSLALSRRGTEVRHPVPPKSAFRKDPPRSVYRLPFNRGLALQGMRVYTYMCDQGQLIDLSSPALRIRKKTKKKKKKLKKKNVTHLSENSSPVIDTPSLAALIPGWDSTPRPRIKETLVRNLQTRGGRLCIESHCAIPGDCRDRRDAHCVPRMETKGGYS